jgi:mannose-6-phosphate isomerase-like protein (cupin superfamily)
MIRNSFLTLVLAAGASIAVPFSVAAKGVKKRITKGFKVTSGKDRFDKSISLFEGDTFSTKVSSKDTDGDIYMFGSTRQVNGGPPLHYHPEQDEWWFVLSGEFLVKVGDETYIAKAGC